MNSIFIPLDYGREKKLSRDSENSKSAYSWGSKSAVSLDLRGPNWITSKMEREHAFLIILKKIKLLGNICIRMQNLLSSLLKSRSIP